MPQNPAGSIVCPNRGLSAKEEYFEEQALLNLSDDERDFADKGESATSRALEESRPMGPLKLTRHSSSFLGPTPKERRAEFESHATKHRIIERQTAQESERPSTAPEAAEKEPKNPSISAVKQTNKLKRVLSLPNTLSHDSTPFYARMGIVPRELKSGKNVKIARDIALEPPRKRLLKEKIIYFYPNDDISMMRRMRIHKVIQLGAAWVTRWRDDITHIILDDTSYTYAQLLRHLNKPGFPKHVVLVVFDPYIPQCIQFGTLLDPTAQRFSIKGAPQQRHVSEVVATPQSSDPSQTSLQIKPTKQQLAAKVSQRPESHSTNQGGSPADSSADEPSSSSVDVVKDSFILSSPKDSGQGHWAPTSDQFDDALSKAIDEAKALAHLPLDEEEDTDAHSPTIDSEDDDGTDEEPVEPAPKPKQSYSFVSKASTLRDKGLNLNTFQCMDPGTSSSSARNPNAQTIRILEEMGRYYDQMQDHWRTTAYRKAVTTLKKQTSKITSAKQAAALPFIGPRLADKIEEIVLTNRLRRLDTTKNDPVDSILRLFLGVYGAGLVQANKWIQKGYRTLDDLNIKGKLTESQKVGIEHYEDFNSRIPRTEVAAHGAYVTAALKRINAKFEATVMGSYRRGAIDSGDIDMIITCPGASASTLRTVVFDQLVPRLFKDDFLKVSLAGSRSNDPTSSKWHGASCLPTSTTWRRLDFLLVPEEELGAALIYFTGNDIFNRSIRLLARKKGMRLNQRGLYKDVQRGKRGEKLNEGELMEGKSEKRIFEILGVPWREPWERIC